MPKENLSEIGSSGLKHYSGIVQEEFIKELRTREDYIRVYKEMRDNDPIVGSMLFAIQMVIRQISWDVKPADETPEAKELADFINTCMHDMSVTWHDFIQELLFTMLPFGWCFNEIVYKIRDGFDSNGSGSSSQHTDGKIGWRKLALRTPESLDHWNLDENGGVQGFVQRNPTTNEIVEIPIYKGLLFRPTYYKNNPEGRSVLRNAYRPWYLKKLMEEIEGIGVSRDLAGLPILYVDPKITHKDATPEQKAFYTELKQLVINIKRDKQEGIVLPKLTDQFGNKLYELILLTTGGNRNFNTSNIIHRYEQRMAMSMLSDFILIGHSDVGSHSLAESKIQMFKTAIKSWVMSISDVLNQHAVPRLLHVNNMDVTKSPKISASEIDSPTIKELAAYISVLGSRGMRLFPNRELEEYLLDLADLPTDEHLRLFDAGEFEVSAPPAIPPEGGFVSENLL